MLNKGITRTPTPFFGRTHCAHGPRTIPLDTFMSPADLANLDKAVLAVAEAQAALDAAKHDAEVLCLSAYEQAGVRDSIQEFSRVTVLFLNTIATFTVEEKHRSPRDLGRYLLDSLPKSFDPSAIRSIIEAATQAIVDLKRFRAVFRRTVGSRRPTITVSSADRCVIAPEAKDALFSALESMVALADELDAALA